MDAKRPAAVPLVGKAATNAAIIGLCATPPKSKPDTALCGFTFGAHSEHWNRPQQESTMHLCKLRISIALMLTIIASPALADSVNGTFETKGKQFKPTDVAAFQAKDRTLVVLSTGALDRKAIANSDDAYAAAINDPAVQGKDYITFWVNGKGVVSMNATIDGAQDIDSSGMIFGAQGGLVASCPTNAKERVTCHVTSVKDPRMKWTVDLAFDSAVMAQTGK